MKMLRRRALTEYRQMTASPENNFVLLPRQLSRGHNHKSLKSGNGYRC
jgi:hypothetical protein